MSRMTGNIAEWGGGNVFLAIIYVWATIRGIQATFIHHRLQSSQPNWRNVVIIWSTAITLIVLAVAGVATYAIAMGEGEQLALTDDQMGDILTWIWIVLTAVVFIFGTRRLSFIRR